MGVNPRNHFAWCSSQEQIAQAFDPSFPLSCPWIQFAMTPREISIQMLLAPTHSPGQHSSCFLFFMPTTLSCLVERASCQIEEQALWLQMTEELGAITDLGHDCHVFPNLWSISSTLKGRKLFKVRKGRGWGGRRTGRVGRGEEKEECWGFKHVLPHLTM